MRVVKPDLVRLVVAVGLFVVMGIVATQPAKADGYVPDDDGCPRAPIVTKLV